MTITFKTRIYEPEAITDIIDDCKDEDEAGSVDGYFVGQEYGILELTVFVKDGVPCISSAHFLVP